jgi:hypothetical protein
MRKTYVVFSLRIANELVRRGFKIIETGINTENPKYKVFYFEDTEEFRAALNEIKG